MEHSNSLSISTEMVYSEARDADEVKDILTEVKAVLDVHANTIGCTTSEQADDGSFKVSVWGEMLTVRQCVTNLLAKRALAHLDR